MNSRNGFLMILLVPVWIVSIMTVFAQDQPELNSLKKEAVDLMNNNKNSQALDVLERAGKVQATQFTAERESTLKSLNADFLKKQLDRQAIISQKNDEITVLKSANEDIDRENFKMIRNTLLFFGILVGLAVLILLNRFRTLGKLKEQQITTDAQVAQMNQVLAHGSTYQAALQKQQANWMQSKKYIDDAAPLLNKIAENKQHPMFKPAVELTGSLTTACALSVGPSGEAPERVQVNLNELIEEVVNQAYHKTLVEFPEFSCSIVKDLEKILPKVELVPDDIKFVIFNLLNNAFYAVREKRSSAPKGYEPKVTVSTRKLPRFIQVRVRDNGIGISEKDPNQVFEPFYSSKNNDQHPGLGLAESKRIITGIYKGELFIESDFTIGTDFIIRFPLNTII